jgi:hypothetical protein
VRRKIRSGDIALAGLPSGHSAFKVNTPFIINSCASFAARFYRVTTATPAESQYFQIRHAEAGAAYSLTATTG